MALQHPLFLNAVRSMLLHFREKESLVFATKSMPRLIVCDFSRVLIAAVQYEYLERKFLIVTGKASKDELAKTHIHVCTAHVMQNVKDALQARCNGNKSQIHFGLRVIGRLIMISNLETCESFLTAVKSVMTNEKVTCCMQS